MDGIMTTDVSTALALTVTESQYSVCPYAYSSAMLMLTGA